MTRTTYGMPIFSAKPAYYPVGADCVLYHAYWDGTAVDHSSYGTNGSVIGGIFVPNGIWLNGSTDEIDVVSHQAILAPHTGDFTVYCWFKLGAVANWHAVFWSSGDNCNHWMLVCGTGYGDNRGWLFSYDKVDSYDYDFFGTIVHGNWPADLNDGSWHMIAYPIDRNGVSPQVVYLDNVPKNSAEPFYTNTYDWQNFTQFDIGLRPGLGGIRGTIGEILMFKSLKSAGDVATYYNSTKTRYGL